MPLPSFKPTTWPILHENSRATVSTTTIDDSSPTASYSLLRVQRQYLPLQGVSQSGIEATTPSITTTSSPSSNKTGAYVTAVSRTRGENGTLVRVPAASYQGKSRKMFSGPFQAPFLARGDRTSSTAAIRHIASSTMSSPRPSPKSWLLVSQARSVPETWFVSIKPKRAKSSIDIAAAVKATQIRGFDVSIWHSSVEDWGAQRSIVHTVFNKSLCFIKACRGVALHAGLSDASSLLPLLHDASFFCACIICT